MARSGGRPGPARPRLRGDLCLSRQATLFTRGPSLHQLLPGPGQGSCPQLSLFPCGQCRPAQQGAGRRPSLTLLFLILQASRDGGSPP